MVAALVLFKSVDPTHNRLKGNIMYKLIIIAVAILSFNAGAADKADIWKCVNNKTLSAEQNCLNKTFEQNSDSEFFKELEYMDFSKNKDAFATISYFPKKQLIEVKSLEDKAEKLLAAKRN